MTQPVTIDGLSKVPQKDKMVSQISACRGQNVSLILSLYMLCVKKINRVATNLSKLQRLWFKYPYENVNKGPVQ
jgi:hypothetical protein